MSTGVSENCLAKTTGPAAGGLAAHGQAARANARCKNENLGKGLA